MSELEGEVRCDFAAKADRDVTQAGQRHARAGMASVTGAERRRPISMLKRELDAVPCCVWQDLASWLSQR